MYRESSCTLRKTDCKCYQWKCWQIFLNLQSDFQWQRQLSFRINRGNWSFPCLLRTTLNRFFKFKPRLQELVSFNAGVWLPHKSHLNCAKIHLETQETDTTTKTSLPYSQLALSSFTTNKKNCLWTCKKALKTNIIKLVRVKPPWPWHSWNFFHLSQ